MWSYSHNDLVHWGNDGSVNIVEWVACCWQSSKQKKRKKKGVAVAAGKRKQMVAGPGSLVKSKEEVGYSLGSINIATLGLLLYFLQASTTWLHHSVQNVQPLPSLDK